MTSHEILPIPLGREIVIDAGYLSANRHLTYALVEVDVTEIRQRLRSLSSETGSRLSFTAFLVASLSRAIESDPKVQAYRLWRRRMVVFQDVDVVTMIEPRPGQVAIPHIIRAANRKTAQEISDEIRSVQSQPENSAQHGGLIALAPHLPRFVRLLFFWILKKNPYWLKRLEGTVAVTSVGMFGKSGGWGISFLPVHTLGLLVGGISQKPGVHNDQIAIREYLHLTFSFDHDIVDGAPAARFVQRLVDLIEKGAVLEDI